MVAAHSHASSRMVMNNANCTKNMIRSLRVMLLVDYNAFVLGSQVQGQVHGQVRAYCFVCVA